MTFVLSERPMQPQGEGSCRFESCPDCKTNKMDFSFVTIKNKKMKRKQFYKLMHLIEKQSMVIDRASDLSIDLLEFMDPIFTANDILIKEAFGEEAAEMISWFMYEKEFGLREDMKVWDKDENEICKTVDQLYDYVKTLKKKK